MLLPTYISGTIQSKAYRLLRQRVYDVLRNYDMTPTYWAMLGIILQARDGIRQVEIANELCVKAPLVTAMAHELENKALVQSVVNQFDGRAKLLAVTPDGKKFMKTVETELNGMISGLLNGLTEQDMMTYQKVLTTIIANDEELRQQ